MVGGFYYQVAREPDMLALAFFITPPPPSAIDQANLAAFSRATVPDEAAMGLQMLNDLSVIEDVDAVLQLHHVNDAICRENAVLLEQAGYPRADCYTFCGLAAPDEAVPAESDPLEL
jgi:hypothetical protein